MSQPDFTTMFFEHFGGKKRKVKYELREGTPHFLHDIAFMSSLLHDSIFDKSKITKRGNKFTFHIERDCWEIPYGDSHLHSTESKLTFTNAEIVEWSFTNNPEIKEDELMTDYIYVSENFRSHKNDYYHFIIGGDDWKCTLKLIKYDSRIYLVDKAIPK